MPSFTPTLARQIACVQREIRLRHRVYAKWVEQGSMTQKVADDEILAMEAVLKTLQSLQADKPHQEALPL
jgi:hypothetical protein